MSEEQKNDQKVPETGAPQVAAQPPVAPGASAPQAATQPPVAAQPPMGAGQNMPPQHPAYVPQPVYPPAPLMQLSGGMKFAWLVIGALLGIPGIIIAWLVNVDKMPKVKEDALKFSIIGFVIWIVLGFLIGLMFAGMVTAMVAGVSSMAGSSGYSYYGGF